MKKSAQNVSKEDLISRKAAIEALYHVDEYNGRSIEAIRNLPSAQPAKRTAERTETHACDTISRRAAIEHLKKRLYETEFNSTAEYPYYQEIADNRVDVWMNEVPAAQTDLSEYSDKLWRTAHERGRAEAQPEIIRCKDCIYYDPPHVENNGVRYEYDEMPADAFDALGTGLVNAEYGINIGGRCCVDYYCKNYSDDKRVFVREDNYCGRAERRTDDCKDNV